MGYRRTCLQRIGLVSTLLIGGVLGGLLGPLPSEAATMTFDGATITLSDTVGTGAGQKYTCEPGYSSCWYLTSSATTTRSIAGPSGTWTVANISTTNRARVRINDVGGTPSTNLDKMNLTGIKITPPANTAGKTLNIVLKHTYVNGQGSGGYFWSMGVTGQFNPSPATTGDILQNQFLLIGKGQFRTPDGTPDPKEIGRLDKGPFRSPTAAGDIGVVTQSVPSTVVKQSCNSDSTGFCKPEITYTYTIKFFGADTLSLTDSLIGAGITCTDAEQDPDIPRILLFLMRLVDPQGVLPTKISGLNDWIDAMAVKYRLNPQQLAKVEKVKVALAKWLLGQTCAGKPQVVVNADAASGVAAGLAAGGKLVTTCSDTNTCGTGTIVIRKTLSPDVIANFGFTGTGSGITDFGILTDQEVCSEGCFFEGSQTFTRLQTGAVGGSRTITETSFPGPPEGYSSWELQSVDCDGGEGQVSNLHTGGEGPLVGIQVNYLNENQTLTCTFHNNATFIFEGD